MAERIIALIGNKNALGEVYQIASDEVHTWKEILDIYSKILKKNGYILKVQYIENIENKGLNIPKYQIIYDRNYDRIFDSKKINQVTGINEYTKIEIGLHKCILNFLKSPSFIWIDWKTEAIMDKITGDRHPLRKIRSRQDIMTYIKQRYL